jgi:hypothetical protein
MVVNDIETWRLMTSICSAWRNELTLGMASFALKVYVEKWPVGNSYFAKFYWNELTF